MSSAKGKSRNEDTATLRDGRMDNISEAFLSHSSGLVELDTVGGFDDADVRGELWGLGSTKVPVFFTRIISSVEHSDSSNVDHEHGGTKDMASSVAPEANTIYF